ncbi:hypothetical protein BJX99DRAFT_264488 [Aspergillus californicus]
MAPRSRSSASPIIYLPHLSTIINLHPEKEPYCAGYAPSQGRRCHNPTNARGRREARSLLNEGTDYLHEGYNINEILEYLAPYVLCTRWHQNQASGLVARWKKMVGDYRRQVRFFSCWRWWVVFDF